MISERIWSAHPHLAWAMWALDEIEATLASIENRFRHPADAHPTAANAVVEMRMAREVFRKSVEQGADDASLTRSKADLEREWAAFENSVQNYLETVNRQVREQETIFRARADAQSEASRQAIESLHKSAARLATGHPGDIEAAIKHLASEADAAKIKLDKLNTAEGASWAAMRSALAETRAALDHAHRSVLDAFERSAADRAVR
jgi:hypothetical protein